MKLKNILTGFALILWTAVSLGQPNLTNETEVATYVRQLLYWPDADPTNRDVAAFRYKHLLYTNEASGIRRDSARLGLLYGAAERARALAAETTLRHGLTNQPTSPVLRHLLLDIFYDRTTAELGLIGNTLSAAVRLRMGPPTVPTGLVIDDEISLYRQAADTSRSVLMEHLSLIRDDLELTNVPPAGYQIFAQLVPGRGLEPAYCLSNGMPISVTGGTNVLFSGFKDLVLLLNGLRDYGRASVSLARLWAWRNNPGDLDQSRAMITDSARFLFLQTGMLRGIFPDPEITGGLQESAASGLSAAVEGVHETLANLQVLRETLQGRANLLGFESDFLMLAQKFADQSGDRFDSFDSLQSRLNPTDLSSPLRYAGDLLSEARDSYADYRESQDQLATQLANITGSANDRLFQIVGALPDTPEYASPADNEGSEIWQQLQSIEAAKLRIERNDREVENLYARIKIELLRSDAVRKTYIEFGNKRAELVKEIGEWKATQAAISSSVGGLRFSSPWEILGTAITGLINGPVQAIGEVMQADKQAELERQAGLEQATIEGIEGRAHIRTMTLEMNTLVVDSRAAALLLKQEVGRLTALLREKADLERTLAESRPELSQRYFADPAHHLRYQHQTLLANLSFEEAQKWLYFMARALEYKWNTPFMNYFHLGRRWSTSSLFKLRNAEELERLYNAMVSFNSLVQLPKDDYFDWFSVREDFFGYRLTNELGQLAYYPDPAHPNGAANLTAIQAFRRRLEGLRNTLGDVQLEFSTVREIPGGTFFRGPRFDGAGRVLSAGLFLDKIKWLKISLPGHHSLGRSQLAGELTYGGSSFIRNFDVGEFVTDRPDRLRNELTAYSTRYWFFHPPSAAWRYSTALKSPVTMQLNSDPRVPPTVQEIDVFKERSVATSGWVLTIPTQDLGVTVLNLNELNDVELYFYHYAVSRQVPEGALPAKDGSAPPLSVPFPYNLRYESSPVETRY